MSDEWRLRQQVKQAYASKTNKHELALLKSRQPDSLQLQLQPLSTKSRLSSSGTLSLASSTSMSTFNTATPLLRIPSPKGEETLEQDRGQASVASSSGSAGMAFFTIPETTAHT